MSSMYTLILEPTASRTVAPVESQRPRLVAPDCGFDCLGERSESVYVAVLVAEARVAWVCRDAQGSVELVLAVRAAELIDGRE